MPSTHGIPDTLKEIESIDFDLLPACIIASNGLTAPGSGLTMLSVSATGYVRRGTDLLYVMQPAQTVTVSSTAGNHWLALTADTWAALAGWTRIPGSHFVEQANATQPPAPDGAQLVTGITVTAGNITAVTPVLSPPLSRQNSNNVDITGGSATLTGGYYRPNTAGDNQYALFSELQAAGGTNRHGIYCAGSAPNYFGANVGIGVEPSYPLQVAGHASVTTLSVNNPAQPVGHDFQCGWGSADRLRLGDHNAPGYVLDVAGVTKLAGEVGIGSNPVGNQKLTLHYPKNSVFGLVIRPTDNDAGGGAPVIFSNVAGTTVGSIQTTAAATSFNTSSDVRLKHAIAPLTGSLAVIAALNPVSHRWNVDDSYAENFLAHELQRVLAYAVTGEPDAVNDDGSVRPQQVDASKIIPRLVGAVKELLTRVETLEHAFA